MQHQRRTMLHFAVLTIGEQIKLTKERKTFTFFVKIISKKIFLLGKYINTECLLHLKMYKCPFFSF